MLGTISSGSKTIDNIMVGGLKTQVPSMVFGTTDLGKSWLCYQFAASCTRPVKSGGLGKKALYIDTEGFFFTPDTIERFGGYFKNRWDDCDVSKIEIMQIPDIFELGDLLGMQIDIKQEENRTSVMIKYPTDMQKKIAKGKGKGIVDTPTNKDKDWLKKSPLFQKVQTGDYGLIIIDSLTIPIKSEIASACLTKGTLVVTSKGLKPIEEIKIGDEVYTHKGNWKSVIEEIHNKVDNREGYTIRQKSGQKRITVTKNHPIYLAECKWDNSIRGYSNEITNLQWISAEETYALNRKYKNHFFERFKMVIPRTEDNGNLTFNDGRITGMILGEGQFTSDSDTIRVRFDKRREKNEILVNEYKTLLAEEKINSYVTRSESSKKVLYLNLQSEKYKNLYNILDETPKEIFSYSKAFANGLLQGLLDANGWNRQIVTATRKEIILLACLHADKYCSVYKDIRSKNGKVFNINQQVKFSACKEFMIKGFFIEYAGIVPESFDIAVEEDHSYMILNGILHNTQNFPSRTSLVSHILGACYPISRRGDVAILITNHVSCNPMSPGYKYGIGSAWGGSNVSYYIKHQFSMFMALKDQVEKYAPDGQRLRRIQRYRYPGMDKETGLVKLAKDIGYVDVEG